MTEVVSGAEPLIEKLMVLIEFQDCASVMVGIVSPHQEIVWVFRQAERSEILIYSFIDLLIDQRRYELGKLFE